MEAWFDGLAATLRSLETDGARPDGLLEANTTWTQMITDFTAAVFFFRIEKNAIIMFGFSDRFFRIDSNRKGDKSTAG